MFSTSVFTPFRSHVLLKMGSRKKSLPQGDIDRMDSSDDENDNLECESLYDSDNDEVYVLQPSDSDSSDIDDPPPRKKARKVAHVSSAPHVVAPAATAPVAGPAHDPAATPAAPRARRRRVAPSSLGDQLVQFNTATISKRNIVWTTRPSAAGASCIPARNKVQGLRPGPTQEASQADTPEKCFTLLFSDDIINEIVQWTNQKIYIEAPKYKQQNSTVQQTTSEEVRAILGLLIFSGYRRDNHLSSKDVWSPAFGSDFYRACMSVGRFTFLLNCMRFDDSQTREQRRQTDKFAPIRKVWDIFIEACGTHYTPHEFLTVDEQLLAFRGNCPFRMYIPNKPVKYGIKIVMANDVKSKYMLAGIPYLGKQGTRPRDGENLGHSFTKELTQRYHHTNRNVTTDNWFTSVPLIQDLLHNCGMTLIGTVRANKPEIPAEMKDKTTRTPGSSAFLFTKDMTLVSYVPDRPSTNKEIVLLLSSMHRDYSLASNGEPSIIEDYNKTKGGVDAFDKMCNMYSCSRRTKRWSLCMFFGILNAGVINSWIIHGENMQKKGGTSMDRKTYMRELAKELVKPWAMHRLSIVCLPRELKTHICIVFEVPTPSAEVTAAGPPAAQSKEPLVRCVVCPSKADKKTRFRCVTCKRPVCPNHYFSTCGNCI